MFPRERGGSGATIAVLLDPGLLPSQENEDGGYALPRHARPFGFARESLVPVSTVPHAVAVEFAGPWTPEPVRGDGARVVAWESASTAELF